MLTKDLLRVRFAGNYVKPQFIKTDDPALLELARNLLSIYQLSAGKTREYIEGFTSHGAASCRDLKVGKGILKIIQDRAEFITPAEKDYKTFRQEIFQRSAQWIKQGNLPQDPMQFRLHILPGKDELYADLPEKECLKDMPTVYPKEILERYNMSLVQALLLHTSKLELKFHAKENPQTLRAICRFLKFYRLLVSAEMKQDMIHMTVDGPASIFENSTKYGLQTALFFPIICRLEKWSAACTVKLKSKPSRLLLDETSPLVCHYHNFSAYQPEEFRMFAGYFQSTVPDWELNDTPGFLRAKHGKLLFPDFAFCNKTTGEVRYLELFHKWHVSQLEDRLQYCENTPDCQLLIGIDRSLLKKDGILKKRLDDSPYFQQNGFFFRDFPGVKNILDLLPQSDVNGKTHDLF